jgi:diguanylate cyclase (GGDEF)-like protein
MNGQEENRAASKVLREEAVALREEIIANRERLASSRERALAQREIHAALRERAVLEREATADGRDTIARQRDVLAATRDERADEADQAATDRDIAALCFEQEQGAELSALLLRVLAANRSNAAGDRVRASVDRGSSSRDRSVALADRVASESDRLAAADDRASTIVDELTGAMQREPGLFELYREVSRAHRSHEPFVLAFLDVDGLKAVNDRHGHGAGDELLRTVVSALRANVRPYDTIVRQGGDEFLCGLAGMSLLEAGTRFAAVKAALARNDPPASVTIGIVDLEPEEPLSSLIRRADTDLYRQRHQT